MLSLGDHLLVALIAAAYPLVFTLDWHRRLRFQLETGGSPSRIRFYRRSMIELWVLTLVVLLWWLWSGRSVSAVGLGIPGGWAFWVGVTVAVAIAVALGRQAALIRASAEARAHVRKQLGGSAVLMVPRGERERRMWVSLSLTAGICEEVLYRGFLMWYAMMWLPAAAAVLASAVVFGVAHVYLGWGSGVLRATAAGAALGVVYLLTGTIWVPIALHAMVDITSGFTGSLALEQGAPVMSQSPAGGEGAGPTAAAQQQHPATDASRRR